MKLPLFLLLLASVAGAAEYEVAYSSWSSSSGNIWMEERSVVYSKDKHKRAVDCFGEQGCLDLAYALNEAHEQRLRTVKFILPSNNIFQCTTVENK